MFLSVVLWKEKLLRSLWRSYDGVDDGHCATIHRVENVGGKGYLQRSTHARASINLGGTRDPMCVTKRSSHVSDLVYLTLGSGSYPGVRTSSEM
jgi:hypothetical protein